jgi:hypothetical protein
MTILLLETTIADAQTICAGCNAGRIVDGAGRHTVIAEMRLNELRFVRPEALTGHSLYLCDECLGDLQWVISDDAAHLRRT